MERVTEPVATGFVGARFDHAFIFGSDAKLPVSWGDVKKNVEWSSPSDGVPGPISPDGTKALHGLQGACESYTHTHTRKPIELSSTYCLKAGRKRKRRTRQPRITRITKASFV